MLHIVHKKLIATGVVFLSSWIIGTFLIHQFEQGHPIGETYFNALYFTVITTATIGFGDLVPMTVAGKILTMIYAVFYVPLFLYVMTLLFQLNLNRLRLADELIKKEIKNVEIDVWVILDDLEKKQPTSEYSEKEDSPTRETPKPRKRHLIAKK